MTASPLPADAAAPAPLAEHADADVACPMCEYNLRGLTEPRCPECGYRFEWKDLLDASLHSHPYLFEHHPKRNLWSFRLTAWRHLASPFEFWSTLKPSQTSRPRRLRLYFILAMLVTASPVIGEWIVVTLGLALSGPSRSMPNFQPTAGIGGFWDRLVSMDPPPWTPRFLIELMGYDPFFASAMAVLIAAVAWPVLTYASLLIFQQTMRRVKVRPIHALRCVVYTADALMWTAPLYVIAGLVVLAGGGDVRGAVANCTPLILLGAAVILPARLSIAYARYMRFDRPVLTVLASQVIVLLAALVILVTVGNALKL